MATIVAFGLSRSQLALAGVLTAFAVGLGALVAVEWSAPEPSLATAAPTASSNASKASAPAPVFSLAPLASFSEVAERPLFSPDRRPPPESDEALGSWSALSLAGIVVTPQAREALIVHGTPAKIVHLEEGQSVDGWVVRSIEADRVVVANGGEQHELHFPGKQEEQQSGRGNPRRATTPTR